MVTHQNLQSRKEKYVFGFLLLLFVSVICFAFGSSDDDDFAVSKREVLLRKIGHELLLQSGDSSSRVLPVLKIAENEYQIRFENEFTFQPEIFVATTRRLLAQDPLAQEYVVNVLNCGDSSVAYGYAVSREKKDDTIACTGRKQPRACYMVNIKFKSTGITTANNRYLLVGLPLLAFGGFVLLRSRKPQKEASENRPTDTGVFTLGSVVFDPKNRKLIADEITVDLTGTETRVLLIFALSPNAIIERSRLQKEIWEDDGVIVGRSLDMFISKLRKKLEFEPNIRIVVIRAKGYRLEIG